jgi:hypothetical protein
VILAELTGSDRCTALGITVNAYAPVLSLCRQLVAAGHDPAMPLDGYRGGVLALQVRSIGEAAGLDINSKGTGFVRLRSPEKAISDVRRGPPARFSKGSGTRGNGRTGTALSDHVRTSSAITKRTAALKRSAPR